MIKRVLLTGASGFIGRHCMAPLCAAGYEVHAVSSRDRSPKCAEAKWHRADLLDRSQVEQLVRRIKPTDLLHFAWYAIPGKYTTSSENLRWCQSTLELLYAFAENGGKRAVFAGTCFEYDSRYGFCNEELTPSRPSTLYGVCKNSTREVVAGFSRQFGISAAWGRIFYLYGPHEPEARLVPAVILALLRGQNAPCGHGRQVRDFLHVEDTASAFVSLLKSELEGTVNIASGDPITIRSLVGHIAGLLNSRNKIEFGAIPAAPNDPPFLVADTRRLREEVGWQPKTNLERGLEDTINWWRRVLSSAIVQKG
ncbi:MAG: NAD-dependent epimerase/dehydratase family protein [Candidatus Binataceae bacterium]